MFGYEIFSKEEDRSSDNSERIKMLVSRNLKLFYADKYIAKYRNHPSFLQERSPTRFPLPDSGYSLYLRASIIDKFNSYLDSNVVMYSWNWNKWSYRSKSTMTLDFYHDSFYSQVSEDGLVAEKKFPRGTYRMDQVYYLSGEYYLTNDLKEVFTHTDLSDTNFTKVLIQSGLWNYLPDSTVLLSHSQTRATFSMYSGKTKFKYHGEIIYNQGRIEHLSVEQWK